MENKTSNKSKKKNSRQTIQVWIFGLIVLQLLVVGSLLMTITSNNSKITQINDKVSRIDSFFANNAPGYGESSIAQVPTPNTKTTPQTNAKIDMSSISIKGEPQQGNPNAKVTIIEYSDYECPFCEKFFSESYGKLKEEYIDTGKINFIFKDFPLGFHQKAIPAAAAANCVLRDLGDKKYFQMHDTIFNNQKSISDTNLKKWALELGIETTSYDDCIIDQEILSEINSDLEQASQLGVTGTPSFLINGELVVGAQPYSIIKTMIETQLNN